MFPDGDRSALNSSQRRQHLAAIGDNIFDVVVVGGGVTGVGAALDAATRGLKVALVEQRDYASGTSSRSSKMFHGGLRYLEQFNFSLVREALAERNLMINELCPHLVTPTSFVYPLQHRIWERIYVGTGVMLYDLMARRARSPLPRHRHLGRGGMAQLATDLKGVGGIQYWDSVVDDARHTLTLARTAAAHGAVMATSTRVMGITSEGPIRAVRLLELETGTEMVARTKVVVNATGVWTDDVESYVGQTGIDVQASKGIHIVVPRDRIRADSGIILRTSASVLFVIPWGALWIVGTTDTPWNLRRAHPAASRTDIEYVLQCANSSLKTQLRPEDIVGVYAGLRPLLTGETENTSKLSREHAIFDRGRGLITVAGGKYTTYRVMASDVIDAALQHVGVDRIPSATRETPLVGAVPHDTDRLVGRYGSLVSDIETLIAARPDWADPVVADAPYTKAEVAYAVTHEGALHLDDVLARRTRLSIETRHRGTDAAAAVADIMGELLGWAQDTIDREIAHYLGRVEAERDSQLQTDDQTADAARMGAPDVRRGASD